MRSMVYLLLTVILLQCGASDQLTGGSSTAGNGVVVGKVHSSAGNPVANVSVYLHVREGDLAADTVTDSTVSGSDGSFRFEKVTAGEYAVFAEIGDDKQRSALTDVNVSPGEEVDADLLILSESGTVAGTLQFVPDTSWTVFAAIRGTPLRDTLDDALAFSISSVPSGRYSLVVFAYTPQSGYVNCIAADSVSIVGGVAETQPELERFTVHEDGKDTLLLDSFDDENKLLLNNRTTWWQYTGGDAEGFEPAMVSAAFNSTAGWDGKGSCAHVNARFDSDNSDAYVGFGCMIDNRALSYHNLFTMEDLSEIRFRIRGTPLECDVVLYSPGYDTYNIVHILDTLPGEWTQVVIVIDDAVDGMDEGKRERWNTSLYWIEQITFNFYKHKRAFESADVYLDDVMFIFKR